MQSRTVFRRPVQKVRALVTVAMTTALCSLSTVHAQSVYFVDGANGDDANAGSSWSAAKATISAALALISTSPDTVKVAAGSYLERITLPTAGVLLGGFPPGGGTRDSATNETIIDGQQGGTVVLGGSAALIDGFTITGGLAEQGGGIHAGGNNIYRNLKVTGNHANGMGSGFFCSGNSRIEGCQIIDNTGPIAPGIAIIGSAPQIVITIQQNIIRHNVATNLVVSGGAVNVFSQVQLDFSYNLVADNTAHDGGLYFVNAFGPKTLDHNTISRNGERGITIQNASGITISNSIIYHNKSADIIIEDQFSNPTIRYSDVGGVQGNHVAENLLMLDPQFADTAAGDYSLKLTSPCRDAGDPAFALDEDGSVTDMGALPYLNITVPVELVSFAATLEGSSVRLAWTTASESSNLGFEVQRGRTLTTFEPIHFVEGRGTTTSPQLYSYFDRELAPGTYFYRLKQIDFNGAFTLIKPVSVQVGAPEAFALEQNYPNPFRTGTQITYRLPQTTPVELVVYDLLGREIAVLVRQVQAAGSYRVQWDGKDAAGRAAPPGMYFYRLKTRELTRIWKMVRMP